MSILRSLIVFFCLSLATYAAPKIASVDLVKVIKVYHKAETDRDELLQMRNALEEDKRTLLLKKRQAPLEDAIAKLQRDTFEPDQQEELVIGAKSARQAYREILAEWESWRANEIKKINKEFVNRSRATLDMITKISQEVGEELGYNWVIDPNGSTSSQMPVVLYVRDTTDITDAVLTVVNKDAPQRLRISKEDDKEEKKDSE